jgi:hypothetical protein
MTPDNGTSVHLMPKALLVQHTHAFTHTHAHTHTHTHTQHHHHTAKPRITHIYFCHNPPPHTQPPTNLQHSRTSYLTPSDKKAFHTLPFAWVTPTVQGLGRYDITASHPIYLDIARLAPRHPPPPPPLASPALALFRLPSQPAFQKL